MSRDPYVDWVPICSSVAVSACSASHLTAGPGPCRLLGRRSCAVVLRAERIREEPEHGELRLRTNAMVGSARVGTVIDVSDTFAPGLEETELPVLLAMPAPRLRVHARETVIAERLPAKPIPGRTSSR